MCKNTFGLHSLGKFCPSSRSPDDSCIPDNIASTVSQFLQRDSNKAFAEANNRVNRAAVYGLRIPYTLIQT